MNCRMFYVSDHSTEFVPSCASTGKSVAGPFFFDERECDWWLQTLPVCMSQLLAMRSKI